ncbi:signal transduction protein [Paenibacillus sp. IHBB 10380]|nr:signal transduction protein [Paenibacillus sp. IHBB 10380]
MLSSTESNLDLKGIANACSLEQLRERRIVYQTFLQQLVQDLPISEWMSLVNQMHDHIAAKIIYFCEQEMEAGYGPPPVSYSFIVFGSAGRRESTLWSDQDNGLIISDEPNKDKARYFEVFGARLCDMLEYLGYEKCPGKVMCSEPQWRKTISEWEEALADWCSDVSWEPVRYLIIASDMRHVAGDNDLSEAFKRLFNRGFEKNAELPVAVLRNTVRHKATLNLLGQVVTERFGEHAGGFDVKYGVYIPLVNFVRFMALQQGVRETSTLKRIEKLISLDAGNMLFERCQEAFRKALELRISTSFTEIDGMLSSSGYLSNRELKNKLLMYELRDSLIVVRRTHRELQRSLRFAERRLR